MSNTSEKNENDIRKCFDNFWNENIPSSNQCHQSFYQEFPHFCDVI